MIYLFKTLGGERRLLYQVWNHVGRTGQGLKRCEVFDIPIQLNISVMVIRRVKGACFPGFWDYVGWMVGRCSYRMGLGVTLFDLL